MGMRAEERETLVFSADSPIPELPLMASPGSKGPACRVR